ncbi:MAG: tetratricopeptide repeat protein [Bacteroidota bacterium]
MICRKFIIVLVLLMGISAFSAAQKSRVFSVFQLIESEDYEDARDAIELALEHHNTSDWFRTFYAKGLLCQKAFEAGFEENDRDKTELYPNQLFVAYEAYKKALQLDTRNRLQSAIAAQYYQLGNDFQKLGERLYRKKEYAESLKAFEHALMVSKSELLAAETDSSLVYNTALAAYESRNWEKAVNYLSGLNSDAYSPNTALLLYNAHLEAGDSLMAEEVLSQSIGRYDFDQTLVLKLVDFMVEKERMDDAIQLLDSVMVKKPANAIFPWTCGQVYQQTGAYEKAIEMLEKASQLSPREPLIYYHLGICHYNIGVAINEAARHIGNRARYQMERDRATKRFREAVRWLERSHELNPGHKPTISTLYKLYYHLKMTEEQQEMELLLD